MVSEMPHKSGCHIANCSFPLPDFDFNDDGDEKQMVDVLVMHVKQHSMEPP